MESLFIVNNTTSLVIIEKHWKAPPVATQALLSLFAKSKQSVLEIRDLTLFHIPHADLDFIAMVTTEKQPLSILFQLGLLIDVFRDYFGQVTEQTLKDNFAVVYQLLEEWVDSGSIYITERALLQQIVPPPSLISTILGAVPFTSTFQPTAPGLGSAVPWRQLGLKYAHNEIFFDISEEICCVIDRYALFNSSNGKLISGYINGQVECLSRLSGMPELLLQLSSKAKLDPSSFGLHYCVDAKRFEEKGTLVFVPPDGNFKLLEYTLDLSQTQIPLLLKPRMKKNSPGVCKYHLIKGN
jgi:AP-3 complex subunit mu